MVRYLINRPIAVFMVYLALILLGFYSVLFIPVSLLPNIDAPEITIKAEWPGKSALQIQQTIIETLRFYLQQANKLDELECEARDNEAIIHLKFFYGSDADKIFFDVNEKLDVAMAVLPREIKRPRVIKASATDIPVFNIILTYRDSAQNDQWLQLSQLTKLVLQKRVEQLPQVAFADVSGTVRPEIHIVTDDAKLTQLNIRPQQIADAIQQSMYNLGSIRYRQGQMIFDVAFESVVNNPDDLKDIRLNVSGRIIRLGDIALVITEPQEQEGTIFYNGKQAIAIATYKTSDTQLSDLKESVNQLLESFSKEYPNIEFSITNDQSYILDLTIGNLRNSLLLGIILAVGIMFLIIGSYRSSLIIALTIPVSLIISMLFFHLIGLSINIISIAGLILGVGMMVDNSIVVIDNINQWKLRRISFDDAVIKGTNEVVLPLLTSMLTTCAVFLPLILLSGLAGEMFYDQAIAVSIGLLISFWVSITLIPVLYYNIKHLNKIINDKPYIPLEYFYIKSHHFVINNKKYIYIITSVIIIWFPILLVKMNKQQMPQLTHDELLIKIAWENNISLSENIFRYNEIKEYITKICTEQIAYIGKQEFLLVNNFAQNENELSIYVKLDKISEEQARIDIEKWFKTRFNNSFIKITQTETAFDKIFPINDYNLIVKIYPGKDNISVPDSIKFKLVEEVKDLCGANSNVLVPVCKQNIFLEVIPERLLAYKTDIDAISNVIALRTGYKQIHSLNFEQQSLPILIGKGSGDLYDIIYKESVLNHENISIPISLLVSVKKNISQETIYSDAAGVYYPIKVKAPNHIVKKIINKVDNFKGEDRELLFGFSGEYFSAKRTSNELLYVLAISVLLLYFILAAQFESIWQPLVVLSELPIDFGLALLTLWLFGGSINVMSLIGLVVMGGIVINDSILKIDTINHLLKEGYSTNGAIKKAGLRRVKSIVMTSATTVLALVPILFGNDIGSELQRPMAITLIAGMFLGTLVSLFYVPVIFGKINEYIARFSRKV